MVDTVRHHSQTLPGRTVRFDAGIRQTEACRGDPVGIEALSGYGQTSKPKPKKGGFRGGRGRIDPDQSERP